MLSEEDTRLAELYSRERKYTDRESVWTAWQSLARHLRDDGGGSQEDDGQQPLEGRCQDVQRWAHGDGDAANGDRPQQVHQAQGAADPCCDPGVLLILLQTAAGKVGAAAGFQRRPRKGTWSRYVGCVMINHVVV